MIKSKAVQNIIQYNLCKTATKKIDKTKILMTNGSLMKVKSIAECSESIAVWSILQYFRPELRDNGL